MIHTIKYHISQYKSNCKAICTEYVALKFINSFRNHPDRFFRMSNDCFINLQNFSQRKNLIF